MNMNQNFTSLMRVSRVAVWLSLAACLAMTSSPAAEIYKADTNAVLNDPGSWVGGVVPSSTSTAIWNNIVSAGNTSNTWSAGSLTWGQITILDPGADVHINSSVSSSRQLIHGIDMSQATRDLTFQVTAVTPWQTYLKNAINIATNRTLTLKNAGTIQFGTLSFGGPGALVADHNVKLLDAGAVLTISSGTLRMKDGLHIGWNGSATANQGGGDVHVFGSTFFINNNGVYNLSGGELNLGVEARIGQSVVGATSSLNVAGGSLTQTNGIFYVGYGSGRGQYVQSGSSTVAVNTLRVESGTLIISNGTFSANTFTVLSQATNSDTRITLAGGTTTLPAFPTIRGADSYTEITFDGGTLRPTAASVSYLQNLNRAYLTDNGAIFDVGSGRDITVAQALENAAGHEGTFNKVGVGRLTLSGTNTYSGSTLIQAGTLALGAPSSISNSPLISVTGGATFDAGIGFRLGSGQTLAGEGLVLSTVTVSGAVSPGIVGIGTLTTSNITWNAGVAWPFTLGAASSSDRLAINGSFTKGTGSGWAFDLQNVGSPGVYTLVTWSASTTFASGDFTANNVPGGLTPTFVVHANELTLTLAGGGGPSAEPVTLYRTTGLPLHVLASALAANSTDSGGGPVTTVWVSATSSNGHPVYLSGSWAFYVPPEGDNTTDYFNFRIANTNGVEAEATATVLVTGATTNTVNVSSVSVAGNVASFTWSGLPGRTNQVEGATELGPVPSANWSNIGQVVLSGMGVGTFAETNPPTPRYYRISDTVP